MVKRKAGRPALQTATIRSIRSITMGAGGLTIKFAGMERNPQKFKAWLEGLREDAQHSSAERFEAARRKAAVPLNPSDIE